MIGENIIVCEIRSHFCHCLLELEGITMYADTQENGSRTDICMCIENRLIALDVVKGGKFNKYE